MNTYDRYRGEDLILRDVLAAERTVMANERTLLGYLRSAIAVGVAGVSLLKLFHEPALHVLGYALLVVSFPVFGVGVVRFFSVRKKMLPFVRPVESPRTDDPA